MKINELQNIIYFVHVDVIFLVFSKLQVSLLFVCFILLFNWCVSLIM